MITFTYWELTAIGILLAVLITMTAHFAYWFGARSAGRDESRNINSMLRAAYIEGIATRDHMALTAPKRFELN